MADAAAARRKAPNPNKDPTLQAEKKAAKAERDAKRKRDEEIKKASWKYGLGAAAVIIGGMCLYSLVTISRATIVTIALNDQAQLKEVFFGGDPWLLQCANENNTISDAFLSASKRMSVTADVKFGAIDCDGKLPSNKTFWQRFRQPKRPFSTAAPVGFLVANNNDPIAIPDKYIKDAKKLSEWTEKYSKPAVQELSWTKTFKKHCMLRDVCVQIHTRGKFKVPAWLRPLMAKHRNLKFVSINRKLHKISFDAAVRMPRSEESARLAVMRRDVGADGLASYSVTQHRGDMTEAAVGHFIEEMAVKRASSKDTVKLDDPIWFDTPPKDAKPKGSRAHKQASSSSSNNNNRRPPPEKQRTDEQGGKQRQNRADKTGEDKQEEQEKARLAAAKQAESQLGEDDDDVVVSDIDDDEEDGLV